MEKESNNIGMLDLMVEPCFCVSENQIIKLNQAAEQLFLTVGSELSPMLVSGQQEYADFTDGCLFLQLKISGQIMNATVFRMNGMDYFTVEPVSKTPELRALALAACELRQPMSGLMIQAQQLMDTAPSETVARLNRNIAQLMRIIGNMSDAGGYCSRQEYWDLDALFREIFEKIQTVTVKNDISIHFTPLNESIISMADAQELERSVLNLVSNAMRYTAKGGSIHAQLTRRDRFLYLRIQDNGSGIPEDIRSTVFRRYMRQPSIEDGRNGIGLGMVIVRNAAANHGGTVLIDQPENSGVRVTLTIAIRQNTETALRSPISGFDYAGGLDHALTELSECLPPEIYAKY